MAWLLAFVANVVILVTYCLIGAALVRSLVRTEQARANRLGIAMAGIFIVSGLAHGVVALHLALPGLFTYAPGIALRNGFSWDLIVIDAAAASVGIWYWRQRSSYRQALEGPALFADLQARRRQALELNDSVVQGLAAAKYALELGEIGRAEQLLDGSIVAVRDIVQGLLEDGGGDALVVGPGDLVRSGPARLPVGRSA